MAGPYDENIVTEVLEGDLDKPLRIRPLAENDDPPTLSRFSFLADYQSLAFDLVALPV